MSKKVLGNLFCLLALTIAVGARVSAAPDGRGGHRVLPIASVVSLSLAAGWLARDSRSRRVERLLASGVLAMAVLLAATIVWNNTRGTWKTAEPVVRAWQTQRQADAPLLFLGARPYSAAFYSHGQAEWVSNGEALIRRLAGSDTAYVVMASERVPRVPADLRRTLRDLGTYGRYKLYSYEPTQEERK